MTRWGAFCLDCRTLLLEASCDDPAHETVPIAESVARVRRAIWGEPETRLEPLPWLHRFGWVLARAGMGVAATIVACLPFSACSDHPLDEMLSERMWGFIALMCAIVVPALIWEGLSEHRSELTATRAVEVEPREPKLVPWRAETERQGLSGLVAAGGGETSPIGKRPCAAWAVWLARDDGVLLRAAFSSELTLRLDDGREVRVPAGRVRFDESGRRERVSGEGASELLCALGLEDVRGATEAWEVTLSKGDRLELYAELDRIPSGYRDGGHELVAHGVPELSSPP